MFFCCLVKFELDGSKFIGSVERVGFRLVGEKKSVVFLIVK